ncbi:MAG: ABC transporter ATP-binding protein, partial [Candidatus Paceibacterota bacterium]
MNYKEITNKAIKQVLGDYIGEYRQHTFQSIVSFLLPSVGNIFVFFIPPLLIGKIVDIFAENGSISLSLAGPYLWLFFGSWILGETLWRIGLHYLIALETDGIRNLANKGFEWLAKRDYDFYTNNFVGSLSKKALAYSRSFETFTDTLLFNVFTNIFPLIFVTVVLWQYSFWIPLILLFCMAVVVSIAIPIIKRRSKLVAERHIASSNVVGRLSDSMSNIFAIKSFAKEKREINEYGKYINDFTQKFKKAADYQNLIFDSIISPLYVVTNVIGLVLAIYFSELLGLQAGMIFVVFSYYSQITRIFWEINRTYRNFESSISEAAEFTQMFLNPPTIIDKEKASDLNVTKGSISFKNATFFYKENKFNDIKEENEKERNSFLSNFSLDIKGKEKVGLVGPSGGGKTTITKLLLRFSDLHSGDILIDEQNIYDVTQKSLRENISYVPQEPLLFHRSLFENIAYAKEGATKEEVYEASRLARADEFINELPEGYDTLVGERGVKLSGGQRQRIAIARAILKNAPILILDEATSSLDSQV